MFCFVLYTSAIANDAVQFVDSMEIMEDQFEDLIESKNLDIRLDETTTSCHLLGQLALQQLENVIYIGESRQVLRQVLHQVLKVYLFFI